MKSLTKLTALLMCSAMVAPGIAVAQTDNEDVITVTARKKEESLQNVPAAVSVVTSESIDNLNLTDLNDIAKITPGLLFDNEFGRNSNRPVIRGQANILGDSGVAFFIDGVYISGSLADYDINDIAQLEVVKGPQSALYGRNTYSGAINIITKSPADDPGFRIRADYSEYDRYEVSASLKGALSDTVAAGVTVRYYDFGGEFVNRYDGERIGEENSESVSGVLEWDATDAIKVRARAYYAQTDDGQPALFHQDASENNCFFDDGSLYGGGGRYYCGVIQPGQVNTDYDVTITGGRAGRMIDTFQTSLSVDWRLDEYSTLTSISGWNNQQTIDRTDGDYQPTSFQTAVFTPGGFPISGFPFPPFGYGYVGSSVDFTFANDSEEDDFSQELRYRYAKDKVEFLLGGYYFDQTDTSKNIRELPDNAAALAGASFGAAFAEQQALCAVNPICSSISPLFGPSLAEPRDVNELDIRNVAIFGSVAYSFTDNLTATLEGRYAEEKIEQVATAQDEGGPVDSVTTAEATYTNFDPRLTVDYQLTPNNLMYFVLAAGHKPGGFNGTLSIEEGNPTFDEELVRSMEAGIKNVFLDGQLIANLSVYRNEVEGYQLTQNVRVGGNSISETVNAGDADIVGFELESTFAPDTVDGLTLTFNYALTDSEFTQGRDQNQGVLDDVADDGLNNCSLGDEFPGGDDCDDAKFGSIVGKQIPRTAEHQVYADIDYRFPAPVGNDWQVFSGVNYYYESSKFSQVHNLAETGDTSVVNARVGIERENFAIRIYGNNLTDEDSSPLVLRYADGADSFKRSFVGTRRRGRHFGVAAEIKF